jgi:hypothetical protein
MRTRVARGQLALVSSAQHNALIHALSEAARSGFAVAIWLSHYRRVIRNRLQPAAIATTRPQSCSQRTASGLPEKTLLRGAKGIAGILSLEIN